MHFNRSTRCMFTYIYIVRQQGQSSINCCEKICATEVRYCTKENEFLRKEGTATSQCFFRDSIENVRNRLRTIYKLCSLGKSKHTDPCVRDERDSWLPQGFSIQFYLSGDKKNIKSAFPIRKEVSCKSQGAGAILTLKRVGKKDTCS